eukprot:CAMPEP_0181265414 /NCGR_PEP_ID=MMETSP1097-20121128/3707_1 /TAXON_ID=35684 /ORGANISM="Pseudopedinella elastica, Strain CCMP716" /LENGTH=52 /DNA_ID=CAMNT_0023364479 /DNA_START=130 /DNA_END=288 /DNA_ORIENTATION=+
MKSSSNSSAADWSTEAATPLLLTAAASVTGPSKSDLYDRSSAASSRAFRSSF